MDRIKLHDKYFRLYIPNEKIEEAVRKTAMEINRDYADSEPPVFLSVLNGSFMFTASLLKHTTFLSELSFVKLSSYTGTSSAGRTRSLIGLSDSLRGRRVIIVEDIVDTGRTITDIYAILREQGAADIRVCTLFLKPDAYKGDVRIDYHAMETGNEFIVGYGLDYDQLGRQLKDIYIIEQP